MARLGNVPPHAAHQSDRARRDLHEADSPARPTQKG